MKKPKGYIIFDETWKRLLRWVDIDPALWTAQTGRNTSGVTLFKTRADARKAIKATKKYGDGTYSWTSNAYVIYEVYQ